MRAQGRLVLWHFAIAVAVATATIATHAAGQSPAGCTGPDCGSRAQVWAPAAQIHEIKNQFVAVVRQLAEALAGTYGDEGPRVLASLQLLQRALVQWEDAIRVYEAMLAKAPESAEGHVALGTVYLDRSRTADALREFATAGRLDPTRADVHSLAALALGLDGKPEDAANALVEASALEPGNPITSYSLAQQAFKAGRQEQAKAALRTFQDLQQKRSNDRGDTPAAPFERVSLLRQAAGVAPIFPLDLYRPGFQRLFAGDYAAGVAAFTRAAAADPLVTDVAGGANAVADGGAALRSGQLTVALAKLEAAAVLAPARPEAHRVLGTAYWADEQYDKSIAQLNAAIRLAPGDERSRMALADVLVEMGRLPDAQHALEEAIRTIPGSGQAHYRLGQLFQRLSLLPRAVHEFEATAALDPLVGLDRLYESIGGLYTNQASFDDAVGAYLRRVDVNPNNAEAHRKLGELYFLQGRDDEALAEYTAAVLLDPRSADAHGAVSQVYLRTSRYTEALEAAQRTLALEPGHKEARFTLATALMRLGRTDEGRTALDVFQRLQADAMANTQRQTALKIIKRDAAQSLDKHEYVAAAALFRRALDVEPDSAAVNRDLGFALMKAGRFDEAVRVLDAAVRLEDTVDAHRLLAEVYTALGRTANSQTEATLAARAAARVKEERLRRMGSGR